MCKFICLTLILLTMSGCCELFGLCTSVNVHTSASSPDKFAASDLYYDFGPWASQAPYASAEPGVRPASEIISGPHFLPPD